MSLTLKNVAFTSTTQAQTHLSRDSVPVGTGTIIFKEGLSCYIAALKKMTVISYYLFVLSRDGEVLVKGRDDSYENMGSLRVFLKDTLRISRVIYHEQEGLIINGRTWVPLDIPMTIDEYLARLKEDGINIEGVRKTSVFTFGNHVAEKPKKESAFTF
jgi:hypothetical protein